MAHRDPARYRKRLTELDLSIDLLGEALDRAAADVRSCTTYDAPAAPGFLFWSRVNRYLAESLTPRRWKHTSRDSILRVFHPTGSHAITAISGEGKIGNLRAKVRSKNPKGEAMARLVERNGQLAFYTRDEVIYGTELDQVPTWFLLYARTKSSIKAELSLPVKMTGKYVDEWHERIPLDLPDIGDPGSKIHILDEPPPGNDSPEVVVEVRDE